MFIHVCKDGGFHKIQVHDHNKDSVDRFVRILFKHSYKVQNSLQWILNLIQVIKIFGDLLVVRKATMKP